jgi:uncharacterized protein DUF4402
MAGRARLPLLIFLSLELVNAARAGAATQNASVNANVVRALTLTSLQNLDLGTITLSLGSWSGAKVGISKTAAFSCSAKLICTGATQPAIYKVTGSNKMVVKITAPNVTMVNQTDPTKSLTLVVDNPGQVTLTSSGEPGSNFSIGGSITLDSTTPTGTYSGTFQVTVDYQ